MPFTEYRVTSPYGDRPDPFGGKNREFHAGIDLVKHHLAPIEAFTEGEVIYAGLGRTGTGLGNYGNVVMIKDKNGYGQLYAHLDSVNVKVGAKVEKGQVIATQGATGRVTGSHLHYEIRKTCAPSYGWTSNKEQSTINPVEYLNDYFREEKDVDYKGSSIVDYLNIKGIDSSFKNRQKLAGQYGIKGYKGTADQNIELLDKMRGGKPKSNVKQLHLPASSSSWRVYPTNKAPVKGNEKGFLNPKKFGGLVYDIIGTAQKDVVTIKTSDFGTVNIYIAPSTGAVIK